MQSPKLIVICGATASGKSGLALQLAQCLNAAIISADSRQIYREFNIGTAKPSLAEQQLVSHYLLDICEPTQTLTLAEYQEQAQALIQSLSSPLLLVGGTGLYIKAITQGLKIPRVASQPLLRQQLQNLGQAQCYQMLAQVDPLSLEKIHAQDQVRTLRALEVFYVTGQPISHQQGSSPPPYPILQIGLDCSAEQLQPLIEQRTQTMLEQGFVAEVRQLAEKYGWNLPLLSTLGYAEIREYLMGQISLPTVIANIILHTRQFAKRQRTWFRGDPNIHWFNATDPHLLEQVLPPILNYLAEGLETSP